MGAGGVAPLVFLSHSGPRALAQLRRELAQRGLGSTDLLRLRLFAPSPAGAAQLELELERMLPRSQWPAVSVVALAHGDCPPSVDAIAASGANRRREVVQAGKTLRFGDWVFIGALDSADAVEQGSPERIEHQSRALFERMQTTLDAAGAQLHDVVKVGGWLSFPMGDYEPLGRVRAELFEQRELFPASAAVQVAVPADDQEPLLRFEAIGFTGPREPDGKPPIRSSLAPYYASARRADRYVFASGEIARRPAPICTQTDDVYEQLHEHISAHGGSLRSVVHQTVYVRRLKDIAVVEQRMQSWLEDRPPTTVIGALDIGFRKGVDVEIELVARTR